SARSARSTTWLYHSEKSSERDGSFSSDMWVTPAVDRSTLGADGAGGAEVGDLRGGEPEELAQHLVGVLAERRGRRSHRARRLGEPDGSADHPHLAGARMVHLHERLAGRDLGV